MASEPERIKLKWFPSPQPSPETGEGEKCGSMIETSSGRINKNKIHKSRIGPKSQKENVMQKNIVGTADEAVSVLYVQHLEQTHYSFNFILVFHSRDIQLRFQ